MDRKKFEKQNQILRNKKLRLEQRSNELRPERPKIKGGAVVRQEPQQVSLMGIPQAPTTDAVLRSQNINQRSASMRNVAPPPTRGGCGGCQRG